MTDPNQQLFAALKAQDGTSAQAINDAATAAEQRWPLLKSLAPQKWAIATPLSDEEKLKRSLLEPIEIVNRKPAASAPNINAQLANALNRMVAKKPIEAMKTPVAEISVAVPAPAPLPLPQSVRPPEPATTQRAAPPRYDDSIAATLQRIEQAHAPAQPNVAKVPGFLSRLGKR
jgi:hypothetical protein